MVDFYTIQRNLITQLIQQRGVIEREAVFSAARVRNQANCSRNRMSPL